MSMFSNRQRKAHLSSASGETVVVIHPDLGAFVSAVKTYSESA